MNQTTVALVIGGGDYDDSGEVDLFDLNLVLFNWNVDGAAIHPSWINQRPDPGTRVGLDQLNGVLFNWGNTGPVTAVPEPATVMLAALGLLAFGILRRGN